MTYSKVFLKSDKMCVSKPEIRFGNYFFQWDENAKIGLSHDEINSFRNFVRKTIPYLEQYMVLLQNESKSSQGNSYHEKKKLFLEEKHNSLISFLLFVDIEGKTTLYRQEKCELVDKVNAKEDNNPPTCGAQLVMGSDKHAKQNKHCPVEIKWLLGELLFDRTENSR